MNSEEKIEALCAVIESLLELIQDEAAADSFREEYQKISDESPYETLRKTPCFSHGECQEDERWD